MGKDDFICKDCGATIVTDRLLWYTERVCSECKIKKLDARIVELEKAVKYLVSQSYETITPRSIKIQNSGRSDGTFSLDHSRVRSSAFSDD